MDWFYAKGEERVGPVDDAEMDGLVRSGGITADTLVWKEGMETWQPLGTVANVAPAPVPVEVAAESAVSPDSLYGGQMVQGCAECGGTFSTDDLVSFENRWVCASCKDVFFQRVREGGSLPSDLQYAGFWIRFGARFVDGLITQGVYYGAMFLVGSLGSAFGSSNSGGPGVSEIFIGLATIVFSFGFPVAYETYFVGKYGATLGKMAVGLRVVMSDGSPVSYGRAFGRVWAYFLSAIVLYIGFIMAAFDEEKRSLHDRICDTRVVRK